MKKIKYVVYRCVSGCGNIVVKPVNPDDVFPSNVICTNCGYAPVMRILSEGKEFQPV